MKRLLLFLPCLLLSPMAQATLPNALTATVADAGGCAVVNSKPFQLNYDAASKSWKGKGVWDADRDIQVSFNPCAGTAPASYGIEATILRHDSSESGSGLLESGPILVYQDNPLVVQITFNFQNNRTCGCKMVNNKQQFTITVSQ